LTRQIKFLSTGEKNSTGKTTPNQIICSYIFETDFIGFAGSFGTDA
jgi:hypothetical protein